MTVTPQDIDAAVLSLNSYDVGSDPSLFINIKKDDVFGNYKVLMVSDRLQDIDHSFVAVAYQDQTTCKIIISYRGTDEITLNPSDDVAQGWSKDAFKFVLGEYAKKGVRPDDRYQSPATFGDAEAERSLGRVRLKRPLIGAGHTT